MLFTKVNGKTVFDMEKENKSEKMGLFTKDFELTTWLRDMED